MITGFRVARGGAQELYGVEPDLTVLGKVIGGGLPAAAFAGPREAMERIAPAGDVYQAGTLSGNPLAVAAGLATLAQLDAAAYERLGALTDRLAAGFARARRRAGRCRSPPRPAWSPSSSAPSRSRDFDGARACDTEAHARFCRALLDRGVYPPPSQFEAWFVSLAHDEATIDRTLEAAAEALARGAGDERRPGRGALRDARRAAARGGHADLAARGRPRRRRRPSACSPPPAPAPPPTPASTRWWSRRSARATSSTTASRACSPATTPTSPCSPATTSTRSASTASPPSATTAPSPSSPT